MVIIFDNSEKYFSVSGLTNTSGTNDTKVGGGVINIPVSLDSVPNDLKNSVPNDLKNSVPNDLKNTQNTHTRDLFEQVKKNMNDTSGSKNTLYSRTKIGDGFMRIDRL